MEKKRFLEGDNKHFCVVSRLLCFFCLFIGIYACQVDEDGVVNKGTLAFRMNVDTALVGVSTKASDLADFKDVNSYAVTIAQDSGVVAEYSRFDKMPAELELGAGAYTIQVSKGTETAAAFDAPYFSGKKEFTIVKDMTTPVEVIAAMANSRVTIDYSDDFLQTYKDYTLSLKTNKMELPLVYEKGESRPMYFLSDASGTKLEIAMELVNVYGKTVNYTATTTIKPKQWAKLTVRTDEKGLNGIVIDVTLNDETKETIYVNIGIPDFMEKLKGAPYIECSLFKWEGNGIQDEPYDLGENKMGSVVSSKRIVDITAGGKIAEIVLTLVQDQKMVFSYDLANLTETEQRDLADNYGLTIDPKEIKGKLQYSFDIKSVLNAIKGGLVSSEYSLALSVKDALPKANTTVRSLKGMIKPVEAPTISYGLKDEEFEVGGYNKTSKLLMAKIPAGIKVFRLKIAELNMDADFIQGSAIENIEYVPSDGTQMIKFTKNWFNSLKGGTYTVVFDIEDNLGQKLPEDKSSFTITVTTPTFEWAMAENDGDVFAKYAYLRVKANDVNKVTFYQNGQQITNLISLGRDETTGIVSFVWTNLIPQESYAVTAKYDGTYDLVAIKFTTEEEGQLPNSGFEDWFSNRIDEKGNDLTTIKWKDYVYWDKWYPWNEKDPNTKGWSTLNQTTTQYGAEPSMNTFIVTAPKSPYVGCCYTTTSGTKPINETSGGSFAALIRTVGWGSGNTAAATSLGDGMGTCEKLTPGELYLGTYDVSTHTPSYSGYAFTSRPSAISFAYKYQPKNSSDWGVAEIEIKDNEDQTLAKKEEKLYSQSSYVVKEIRLDYSLASKAAKIYMKFKSSGNSECWEINSTNLTPPPAMNLSDGEYVGSQLYIDDVELIYDYLNE